MSEDQIFEELEVDDLRGVLEFLYREHCHPLQFLREFTENAIGAIRRAGGTGQIVWDYDRVALDQQDDAEGRKLCVIDNGAGMTGPELVRHLTEVTPNGDPRAVQGQDEFGAVIAAAAPNPAGLQYISWTDGEAVKARLYRRPDGHWGIQTVTGPDGAHRSCRRAEDYPKPEIIDEHGTKVVFMGESPEDCTMDPPVEEADRSRWIARYLNSRYFRLPDGITLRARVG